MPTLPPLEPAIVWRHFATLLNTPRPSKRETVLRDHLRDWAIARGLATHIDAAGNLIVAKPASKGMENRPGVILQAHLDMVCQKNSGTVHDFDRDPIRAELQEGWLVATETTLGADNGIGVALALAALESPELTHPPLEALFTVDEEDGMGGAQGLEPGQLAGRLMINLDTEDWGEVYLGCAGGVDVNATVDLGSEPLPDGLAACRLAVRGLRGGHSGMDIHLGRGNAIKILVRALQALETLFPGKIRLVSLAGGNARNALPREAEALLALPEDALGAAGAAIEKLSATLVAELAGADDGLQLDLARAATTAERVLPAAAQARLLAALLAAPCGVRRMSQRVAGVVETSNNLGIVRVADGRAEVNLMVRSLIDSAATALAEEIVALFRLAGASATVEGAYPGWSPNPDSPLLALFQQVWQQGFGNAPAAVKVVHAGLECGILKAKYPHLDIISFGPDIRGAHAPGERVRVDSVGSCWQLLGALLAAVAPAAALPA